MSLASPPLGSRCSQEHPPPFAGAVATLMHLVSFIRAPSSFSHVQSGLLADSFFMLRLYLKSWGR